MPFIIIPMIMLICLLLLIPTIADATDGHSKGLFVVLFILFCSILWISIAHCSREVDTSKETFHSLVIDVQDDVDAQCVRVIHEGSVRLVNLNEKFNGMIRKDTIVRRYCLEMWKYGLNFLEQENDYIYELIAPEDDRYKKVNKIVEKQEFKRSERYWEVNI